MKLPVTKVCPIVFGKTTPFYFVDNIIHAFDKLWVGSKSCTPGKHQTRSN